MSAFGMEPEYLRLAADIKARAGGKAIYYVANFGNWGDAMIRDGALRFFRHFGIAYRERFSWRRRCLVRWPPGGRLLVFGGGGA